MDSFPRKIKQLVKRSLFYALGLLPKGDEIERLSPNGHPWAVDLSAFDEHPVVYSFGISDDIEFEVALLSVIPSNIHVFDPTPTTEEYLSTVSPDLRNRLIYDPVALGAKSGKSSYLGEFDAAGKLVYLYSSRPTKMLAEGNTVKDVEIEFRSLEKLMEQNGHKSLALLKIDIEGHEYDVLESLLKSGLDVKQLAVEFHYRFAGHGLLETRSLLRRLCKEMGYEIRFVSPWCEEFLLVKK